MLASWPSSRKRESQTVSRESVSCFDASPSFNHVVRLLQLLPVNRPLFKLHPLCRITLVLSLSLDFSIVINHFVSQFISHVVYEPNEKPEVNELDDNTDERNRIYRSLFATNRALSSSYIIGAWLDWKQAGDL